jgi:hypothetical protein
VYRTTDNEGYKTLDGIDVCGLRIAREIEDQIEHLGESGKVMKLSVVGYSLGGLISRFAVGILHHKGLFEEIEPVNFTTFCTPHVGVLTPGSNVSVRLFNWLIPNLLSLSGKQMFLKDFSGGKDGPLLLLMANPNSVFYRALQCFKYRNLYANAINDRRTAWWTAGISLVDPFMKIDERSSLNDLDYTFIEDYEPVVIDAHAPFKITNKPIISTPVEQSSNFWQRKYRWLVVFFNLVFFMPLWITWFVVSGMMETFKSHRRVRSILKDYNTYFTDLADLVEVEDEDLDDVERIKTIDKFDHDIEQTLQDRADTLMESVWDAMTSKNTVESAKLSQLDFTSAENELTPVESELGGIRASINELAYFSNDSQMSRNELIKIFTLDLSPTQLDVVKSLNNLQWEKYPILIRHTQSTHSAAIVRNIDETALFEGKVVVKHWLDKVLKLE